jgi:carbamoyl-phosphate synthase large subunit
MKTILVTGCGAPGTFGTYRMLHDNPDNEKVKIIGTDMDENAMGRFDADEFHITPPAVQFHYFAELNKIIKLEKVDVVVPQNTMELVLLANKLETPAVLNNYASVVNSNNKKNLLNRAKEIKVPIPDTFIVDNVRDFYNAYDSITKDGGNSVFVKMPVNHGSRGTRQVVVGYKPADYFMNKPNGMTISSLDIDMLYETHPNFVLLVQEELPGPEYTVDAMGYDGWYEAVPRHRMRIKNGITHVGEVENRLDIIRYSKMLSEHLDLNYPHGFQFKEGSDGQMKLLECNPRVQGTMIATHYAGWNILWDGVRMALGMDPYWQHANFTWGTKVIRYTDVMKFRHNVST